MAHPGGCCCDHSADAPGAGEGESLLPYIDTAHVSCLNEKTSGSAKHVFKAFTARTDRHCSVESPSGDPVLIFKIPFTCGVRVRAICISGGPDGRSPSKVKLFVNDDSLDFSGAVEGTAAQDLRTPEDSAAEMYHPLKPAKFGNVFHLTVAMPGETNGGDDLQIWYIGLKGEATGVKRTIVDAVYESRPVPQDHAAKDDATMSGSRLGT